MSRALLCILLLCLAGCQADQDAGVIARALEPGNKLGVTAYALKTMDNPRGEGTLVYVKQTRFRGTERYLIWLVLDGQGYALNGPSKGATPSLPWPREAPETTWGSTGLDRYSASDAIEIVFGKR